jgi:hypothetical protein
VLSTLGGSDELAGVAERWSAVAVDVEAEDEEGADAGVTIVCVGAPNKAAITNAATMIPP